MRQSAKCYPVRLGGALPWCCALLLRRTSVRVGRSAWRSFAQRAKAQQEVTFDRDAMDIPANGGARLPEDVVVDTRYIYTLALALVGLALATCAILLLMIDF